MTRTHLILSALAAAMLSTAAHAADAPELYATHCAACHGDGRLGGTGPALIPQTLGRMRGPAVAEVITHGRPATQMPAFADTLAQDQITAISDWLATPLDTIPAWGEAEIRASREMAAGLSPRRGPVLRRGPVEPLCRGGDRRPPCERP